MKTFPFKKAAFSLVEVAIALGVTAVSLVPIFGMLPIGMKSNQASVGQTAANGILAAVAADLRATPPTVPPGLSGTSQLFSIPIPANSVMSGTTVLYFSKDGQSSTQPVPSPAPDYRLTVTSLHSGTNAKAATCVKLQISWPGTVDVTKAVGSAQTFIALDRN